MRDKEKEKAYNKEYYQKNKEKIKARVKIYAEENQEKIKEDYKKNKEEKREYQRNYQQMKRNTDPQWKMMKNMRVRISSAVRGSRKSADTVELLGCSVEDLRDHLESQFTEGMSWDNYGYYGWHVDHIKPCASFDLSLESEQRKCFNCTNLQPLWAADNLSKSDKFISFKP